MAKIKKIRNVKKGDTFKLEGDPTVFIVVKVTKGYDDGWKKITYVEDEDYIDDDGFHKLMSADGDLDVTVITQ